MPLNHSWRLVRLIPFVRPYGRRFLLGAGANVLARACDLAPMVLVGRVVDAITAAQHGGLTSWRTLLYYGLAVLVSFLLLALFQTVSDYQLDNIAQQVRHDLRVTLYEHLQRQDMRFFEDRQAGDLLSVVSSDVDTMENFLADATTSLVRLVVTFAGTFGVLFWLDWRLALLLLAPMPVAVAAVRHFATKVRPRYRAAREAVGQVSAVIDNNLRGMGVIQAFTAEAEQARLVRDRSADYRDEAIAATKARARFIPTLYAVAGVAYALLIAGGGWLTLEGLGPTLGDYATFVLLAMRLVLPLFVMGMLINQVQRSEAAAGRITALLDLAPRIDDKPDAMSLEERPERVDFDDVRFAYPDRPAVINGVSLRLRRGRVLGVVGPTGAGKSTLVKLLLRHVEPASGAILLNGRPLGDYTLQSLRRHMGYVSQDAFLFSGTVADNIRLGSPQAPDDALRQAAEVAGAWEFIRELPHGFDTPVGEGGVKLSGGQRQRISLARAVLRDPAILILDEATSAVDTRTEELIQTNLLGLRRGRMTLAVAHRLSTIRHSDEIVVLVDGVIVERGTHEELLDEEGVYAGLWAVQSGEGPGSAERDGANGQHVSRS
ncbi:ABC transporter ATP-binding protein [Fundidesulfovibrio butyratiphilus]